VHAGQRAPNFPDLTESGGIVHLGFTPESSLNPNSPTFQKANTLCAKRTGVRGIGGINDAEPGEIIYNGGLGANG
jgi:hypothetical protein